MRAALVALVRLWRLLWHRKPKAAADDLPPDRVVGNTVYRAFRIPATATVEAFTDALDLTVQEAASWDPTTESMPLPIRARQQERYRNWLRARKGTPSRARATEDGEAPKLTARPARMRPISPITSPTRRTTLPGTQPHHSSRPPLKTVGHYPLGGVRPLPNFIIGDAPGVERRCSCGAHFQGSADDVAERWQDHLRADEQTFGSKAADRVFAWLEKHQERYEGRAGAARKAGSVLSQTTALGVLFFIALAMDARRSGRWEHDFKDPLIQSIAEAARSVGATAVTITASAAGGNSNVNASWVGSVQPTSANDVVIDGTSAGITIPSTTTLSCRSLNATGGKLTFAATTSTLSAGDASGGAVTFSNTSTVTLTAIGTINFLATTGSTTYSLTTGGRVMPNVTVNTGTTTTIQFADALTATGATVTLTQGKLDTNGFSVNATAMSSSNSNTRSLLLGASSLTLAGAGTVPWNLGTSSGLTFTAGASTITFTGAGSPNFGTQTYNAVIFSSSGTPTLNGAATFASLTRTGTAAKTDAFTLAASIAVTGALTLGGNTTQGVNRLLVQSSSVGTQRSITVGSVVINGDVDFSDIAIGGSPSWTNTGAAYIGDGGGNNNTVTTNRTAPANQTATGTASFTWSTHGWTSRVPLPQDNVFIPNAFVAGRTITADMPRLGASIDFTSGSGSPILSIGQASSLYGSLALVAGVTPSGTSQLTFAGRSTCTLTTAAAVFTQGLTVNAPSGTLTLGDALSVSRSAAGALTVTNGTLVDGGFSVALSGASSSYSQSGGTLTKTGAWSIAATAAASFWSVTGGTISSSGSTTLTVASANARTFAGGGKTYGTLTYTVAGSTGSLTVTGANTYSTINFSDATNARTLILPASTVTTVTGAAGFNVQGLAGKRMTVQSSTGATAATLSLSATGDTSFCNYQDIAVTGSPLLARRGRNVSGNSGITFPTIPVFDAAAAGTSSALASSLTFAATVNAGTNRLLRVGVSLLNAASQTVTGITYGGVALTSLGTVANGTAARAELWYLANPAVGTANVVVTLSAAAAVSAGADTWSNVDQGGPFGSWTTATGSSSTVTVDVTSSTLEQVVDVAATAATDLIVGPGQTSDWDNAVAGVTGAGSRELGATTTTMSWTSTLSGVWATGAAPMFGALVVSATMAGSSNPVGTVVDTVKKFLAGSETPAGAVADTASKPLAGSTTPSGALTDTTVKVASGSTAPSGGIIQTADKGLSGSVTPSGQVRDTVSQLLTGSETPAGVVTKTTSTHMAGSETPSGAVVDTPVKALSGSETPSGSVTKNASIHLSGSETPTGAVVRTFVRDLFGSLTPSGILHTTPAKALGGVLTPIGNLLLEAVHFIRDRRSCEVPTPTLRRGIQPGIPGLRSPRLDNAAVDPWTAEWSTDIDGGTPSGTGPGVLDGGDL